MMLILRFIFLRRNVTFILKVFYREFIKYNYKIKLTKLHYYRGETQLGGTRDSAIY